VWGWVVVITNRHALWGVSSRSHIVELVVPLGLGHHPMQDYLVEEKLQEEVPDPLPSLVLSLWEHGLGNVPVRAARM
jgi:hypothetical protein